MIDSFVEEIKEEPIIFERKRAVMVKQSLKKNASEKLKLVGSNFNHQFVKRSSLLIELPEDIEHHDEEVERKPVKNPHTKLEKRAQSTIGYSTPTTVKSDTSIIISNKNVIPIKKIEILDTQTAKAISQKSFLLDLKELLLNYIEYNNLFYAKEYMAKSTLLSTQNESANVVKALNTPRIKTPLKAKKNDDFVVITNWKEGTISFRHTVNSTKNVNNIKS